MPELQGIGQVHLLSLNDDFFIDKKTGVNLFSVKIMDDEIRNIISKATNWINLKRKENKMAITDTNIILTGNKPQDILLGASSSFIVQNISNNDLRFKVKGSSVEYGGVLSPRESFSFAHDITVWAGISSDTANSLIYIIRD